MLYLPVTSIMQPSLIMPIGTFPVVALMVGTAVLRLSNCTCVTNDMLPADDDDCSDTMVNSTTCENEPVDIAVTLSFMVGIFMVSIHILKVTMLLLYAPTYFHITQFYGGAN